MTEKNNNMLNKRGTSSLEIVISFLIFIGFLFFLFLLFPINRSDKSSAGLDSAERGIMNVTGTKITYFSVIVNQTEAERENVAGCIGFELNTTLSRVLVRNETNSIVSASLNAGKLYINGTKKYYQAFSSPEINENNFVYSACKPLESRDFNIGLVRFYDVLVYNKILELNSSYYSKYSDLIINFSMPRNENFAFSIREIDGSDIVSASRGRPERGNVLSRNTPVQILYPHGEIKYAILNIQTW